MAVDKPSSSRGRAAAASAVAETTTTSAAGGGMAVKSSEADSRVDIDAGSVSEATGAEVTASSAFLLFFFLFKRDSSMGLSSAEDKEAETTGILAERGGNGVAGFKL